MNKAPHTIRVAIFALLAIPLVNSSGREFVPGSPAAASTHGIVSATHPTATDAGLEVLKSGGNAIDAAVAVGLMLGVVDGDNSGIGGGCLMLIRLADGRIVAIDGREKAPAAATRDMFIRNGRADPALSQTGALASGVPGEIAAFHYAVKNFGRKQFGELFKPGASIAAQGFLLGDHYAARLKADSEDLAKFNSSRDIFFKNGTPLKAGDILKQPDLARTYRQIGLHGPNWFYRGPFAEAAEAWMKSHGGIMTAKDFADYRVKLREPVSTDYRGYEVVTFSPPSSGGVHLLEMLNTLEHFDLKKLDEAHRLHVIAEAMKLAFADRAYWLGDPDFVKVPRGLISKTYAAELAKKIDVNQTMPSPGHGMPPDPASDVFGDKHTTHFSVADAEGNWVACTCTVNTGFGSKVVVPGTGVLLNDEMDDFSAQPGVPNYFGLVGNEANAVAPGKRPLSSMTPTIVLKNEQPIIAIGAAGGPKIITAVLLELISMLDLKLSPGQALAMPRIHHQWSPDELFVETSLRSDLKKQLQDLGHKITEIKPASSSHVVARSADGKTFTGAADPRSGGTVAGW
jgi:gamma-glutamyltranspeptidase/glutathione hydrolase